MKTINETTTPDAGLVLAFGERVRAAMLASGLGTPAQLGKACTVSRQTAGFWLGMKEAKLSAVHLLALSNALHVRMRWLVTGRGLMLAPAIRADSELERAVAILVRLSPPKERKWLEMGQRMADA